MAGSSSYGTEIRQLSQLVVLRHLDEVFKILSTRPTASWRVS